MNCEKSLNYVGTVHATMSDYLLKSGTGFNDSNVVELNRGVQSMIESVIQNLNQ